MVGSWGGCGSDCCSGDVVVGVEWLRLSRGVLVIFNAW